MAKATGKAGTVLFSPHIHGEFSIERIMWDVVIALIPAGLAGVYFFGYHAAIVIGLSVATALVTEALMNLMTRSKLTILDGSAVITGLLFAYNLPPASPWYVVVVGSAFAIALVKWAFGGLGYNFMNPALGGRIFVLAAWSNVMIGHWSPTIQSLLAKGMSYAEASKAVVAPDALTTASPLTVMKAGGWEAVVNAGFNNYLQLFLGNKPGCIGEVSILALLIGLVYLVFRKVLFPLVPVIYIGTVALLIWVLGGLPHGTGLFTGQVLFHVLSGGLVLGAVFMATDYVTGPIGLGGKILFAFLLGLLTVIIRLWGGYPEGVSYAIVFMNIFVPLIDRYLKGRVYGHSKAKN